MKNIFDAVDSLSELERTGDKHRTVRTNPVTGGRFVQGLDPVWFQKLVAVYALEAGDWFSEQAPSEVPGLPLTAAERERCKSAGGVHYIVSLFARSLAYRNYSTSGHPGFDEYARGVMASPLAPWFIRNDADLLKRYPPTALAGMSSGCVWRGSSPITALHRG